MNYFVRLWAIAAITLSGMTACELAPPPFAEITIDGVPEVTQRATHVAFGFTPEQLSGTLQTVPNGFPFSATVEGPAAEQFELLIELYESAGDAMTVVGRGRLTIDFSTNKDATPFSVTIAQACSQDTECDDGLFCNGVEVCNQELGVCGAGPAACPNDGCVSQECDEDANACINRVAQNSACEALDPALCAGGVCFCNLATVECELGAACSNPGAADPTCDDGLFCNGVESCGAEGQCVPGTAPDTNDNSTCTVDSCDEDNDVVVNTHGVEDGTVCTTGNDAPGFCIQSNPEASGTAGCFTTSCGDGYLDPANGESCDDGNDLETDACLSNCEAARCGDGSIQAGVEECETTVNTAQCNYRLNPMSGIPVPGSCLLSTCGDGFLNALDGEICDDGVNNGAGIGFCDATCSQIEACGNGIQEGGEECDDGNNNDQDDCTNICRHATCTDGIERRYTPSGQLLAPTDPKYEQCDDGNSVNTDACTNSCLDAICGDGIPRGGLTSGEVGFEECDTGGDSPTCDGDCTLVSCGDNYENNAAGEDCDEGAVNTATCDSDCTDPVCGDALENTAAGEECDEGMVDTAMCDYAGGNTSDSCTDRLCGDGYVNSAAESCEESGGSLTNDNDGCAQCVETQWAATQLVQNFDPATSPEQVTLVGPQHIAVDPFGSYYVADNSQYQILRISPSGAVVRIAGTGERCNEPFATATCGDDGAAVQAPLVEINGLAVNARGDVFFSESLNRIRMIEANTGLMRSIVNEDRTPCAATPSCGDNGPAGAADLTSPGGLSIIDGDLYIADTGNHLVRRVQDTNGIITADSTITSVAGNGAPCADAGGGVFTCGDGGAATSASMTPRVIKAVDEGGGTIALFVSDSYSGTQIIPGLFANARRIRRIEINSGTPGNVTAVVGDPAGFLVPPASTGACSTDLATAFLGVITGIEVANGIVYISDEQGLGVFKADPANPSNGLCRIAGDGLTTTPNNNGPACSAGFNFLKALAFDPSGDLLVADSGNDQIRRITVDGSTFHDCDSASVVNNQITTFAGGIGFTFSDNTQAQQTIPREPVGIVVDDATGDIYFTETETSGVGSIPDSYRVRKFDAATGRVVTIAGEGEQGATGEGGVPALTARFVDPFDLELAHGSLYVADRLGHAIRRIDLNAGTIETVAGTLGTSGFSGDGGLAASAELDTPTAIAIDSDNNLYIADSGNQRIRRVNSVVQTGGLFVSPASSTIVTIAGGGTNADFSTSPAVDQVRLSNLTDIKVTDDGPIDPGSSFNILFFTAENQVGSLSYADLLPGFPIMAGPTPTVTHRAGNMMVCTPAAVSGPQCGDTNGNSATMDLSFNTLASVAYSPDTGLAAVIDATNRIRVFSVLNDQLVHFAGSSLTFNNSEVFGDGGTLLSAGMAPAKIASYDSGTKLLISEPNYDRIRSVDGVGDVITTVVGNVYPSDGELAEGRVEAPQGIAPLSEDAFLIADGSRVRSMDTSTAAGALRTRVGYPDGFVGNADGVFARLASTAAGIAVVGTDAYYTERAGNRIRVIDMSDPDPDAWTVDDWLTGTMDEPTSMVWDSANTRLLISEAGTGRILEVNTSGTLTASVFAGGSSVGCPPAGTNSVPRTSPFLTEPTGLAIVGSNAFVADGSCPGIWKIALSGTGNAERVLGNGQSADPVDNIIGANTRVSNPRALWSDGRNVWFTSMGGFVGVLAADSSDAITSNSIVRIIFGYTASPLEAVLRQPSAGAMTGSATGDAFWVAGPEGGVFRFTRSEIPLP